MKLNTKKIKKISIYFIGTIVGLYLLVGLYSLVFEQDKLAIDRYNFEQLEKAKPILESMPEKMKKFRGLTDFNKLFKADIKPVENCYYVSNNNGNQKYIFGFQLKSKIYQFLFLGVNYAYHKYDLPISKVCYGGPSCEDKNIGDFIYAISNPCKE